MSVTSSVATNKDNSFAPIREALHDGNRSISYLRAQTPGGKLRLSNQPEPNFVPVPDILANPVKLQTSQVMTMTTTSSIHASSNAVNNVNGTDRRPKTRESSSRHILAGASSHSHSTTSTLHVGGHHGSTPSGGGHTSPTPGTNIPKRPQTTNVASAVASFLRKTSSAVHQREVNVNSDVDTKSFTVANRSSHRVGRVLKQIGIEPNIPTLDFNGNITVHRPRLPEVFENSTRSSVPLAGFRTEKNGNVEPIPVPRIRPAAIYDIGNMGQQLFVQIAPDAIPSDIGEVRLTNEGLPKPPQADIYVSPDEIHSVVQFNRKNKSIDRSKSPIRSSSPTRTVLPTSNNSPSHPYHDDPENKEQGPLVPPRLSDKLFHTHHIPPLVTLGIAATHSNPYYRVVNHNPFLSSGNSSTVNANNNDPENTDDVDAVQSSADKTQEDIAAAESIRRMAYASVGLPIPEPYAPGKGLMAMVQHQMVAAEGAARRVDRTTSRCLAAELAIIDPQIQQGKRLQHVLEPALALLRPPKEPPVRPKTAITTGTGRTTPIDGSTVHGSGSNSVDENNDDDEDPLTSQVKSLMTSTHTNRFTPFGVPTERLVNVPSSQTKIEVTPSGMVKVGPMVLDPAQTSSMAELQKINPSLVTAVAGIIKNTTYQRKKIMGSKAKFAATTQQAAEVAMDAVDAYRYRLGFSRGHRFDAIDDVLELPSVTTGGGSRRDSSSSSMNHTVAHDDRRGSMDSKEHTVKHVNLGSALESVAAMRIVTARELLLDEADTLDTISELIEMTVKEKWAGIGAIEREFLSLLQAAVEARAPLTRAFAFKLLENMHTAALALPASVLQRPGDRTNNTVNNDEDTNAVVHDDDVGLIPRSKRGLTPPRDPALETFDPTRRRKERWDEEDELLEQQKNKDNNNNNKTTNSKTKTKTSGHNSTNSGSVRVLQFDESNRPERYTPPKNESREQSVPLSSPLSSSKVVSSSSTSSLRPSSASTVMNNGGIQTSFFSPGHIRPASSAKRRTSPDSRPTSSLSTTRDATERNTLLNTTTMPLIGSNVGAATTTTTGLRRNSVKRSIPIKPEEPLAKLPAPLLTEAERYARSARRSWPIVLHYAIDHLLSITSISMKEYDTWLRIKGLDFPSEEAVSEFDVKERQRAIKEIAMSADANKLTR